MTHSRPCHLCHERSAFRELYRKDGFGIVRCESCSLVFTRELPSAKELRELYSSSFFRVGAKYAEANGASGAANASSRIRQLLSLPGVSGKRWLDVGCATGDFLSEASRYVGKVEGVDLSGYAVERARARGIAGAHEGDFLEIRLPECDYEIVTMWDFIEHVHAPRENLRKAFALLRPGGYVVVSTGDVESLLARLMGRFWHLMIPPKHLYFFSETTLRRLLLETGFDSVAVRRPGKRVPVDMMLWKTGSLASPKAGAAALRVAEALRLGRFAPYVNLFDIMTVTARKPDRPEPKARAMHQESEPPVRAWAAR